jgi:phosphoribosyl 1,2-cyclic phosphodiesterase
VGGRRQAHELMQQVINILAQLARVRRLVLFHHEPAYDDARIERVFGETVRYEEISRLGHKVEVISAYDGLELRV